MFSGKKRTIARKLAHPRISVAPRVLVLISRPVLHHRVKFHCRGEELPPEAGRKGVSATRGCRSAEESPKLTKEPRRSSRANGRGKRGDAAS